MNYPRKQAGMPSDGIIKLSPREGYWDDDTVAEFSRIFHSQERAVHLVQHAGFPLSRIPAFTTPLEFWTSVVQEMRNGVLHNGLSLLASKAAGLYPANPIFAQCYARAEQVCEEECDGLSLEDAQSLGIEDVVDKNQARAEAARLEAEAEILQMNAQEKLAQAQAFRELAETIEGLQKTGHEIFFDNVDGKGLKLIVIRPNGDR